MLAFTIVLVIMTVRLIMTGLVISGHHIMLILVTMVYYTGHNDRTACSAWSMVIMYWTGHRDTVGQIIVLILHGYHAGSD